MFTKKRIVEQINENDLIYKLGKQIFSGSFIITENDEMIYHSSLEASKEWAKHSNEKQDKNLAKRNLIVRLYYRIFNPSGRFSDSGDQRKIENFKGLVDGVFFDLHESGKPYMAKILKSLNSVEWFSLRHGPNLLIKPRNDISNHRRLNRIKAFLHSAIEAVPYKESYGISEKDIRVIGVPRHEARWIDFILKLQEPDIPDNWNGYVFLVSRPGTTAHFDRERKEKAVRILKEVLVDEFGLKIAVKMHPKEYHEGIYENVLGEENYGSGWIYSENHPYILGKNSLFAITFLSSVCIDMVALGVPVIEFLDLTGFTTDDNSRVSYDDRGNPIMEYRQLGLVLGASNKGELTENVKRILKDKETVIDGLMEKYRNIYPDPDGSIKSVCDEIFSAYNE